MNQMLSKIGIVVLFCLFYSLLQAQDDKNYYEYLHFREFLSQKVPNDSAFIINIYKSIRYPYEAKKIRAESMIEFIMINHNERDLEIVMLTPNPLFFKDFRTSTLCCFNH